MNDFDKKLDFDSNTFEDMKHDMNFVLQRLLGNMIEKQSNEGSASILRLYLSYVSIKLDLAVFVSVQLNKYSLFNSCALLYHLITRGLILG